VYLFLREFSLQDSRGGSVRWGEGANDSCQLPFDISGKDSNSPIIRLNETCQS
ncbi:hypothetical protein, partial [Escherichia coli]